MTMNYEVRIDDKFLKGDHKDGEVLTSSELNELENVVKTAINANYEDIQKLGNGEIPVGDADTLTGASLSKYGDEALQNSDTKIPTSMQVKQYVDNGLSNIDLEGYYTKREVDDIVATYDSDGNGIVDNAEKVNNHTVNKDVPADAKFTDTIVTKTSELTNDSGFLTTETDPVFGASPAKNITNSNISNWNSKQAALVSGSNIKTINGSSILGSGNLNVQTNLTAGDNISITNNVISATDTKYTGGTNVTIDSSNAINVDLSGKQDVIDSSHKVNADLIDDTNSTNKFTSASEKTTWNGKQDALVSGTNIKTINNTSLLGSGNIDISGGSNDEFTLNYNNSASDNLAIAQDIYDFYKDNGYLPKIRVFDRTLGNIYDNEYTAVSNPIDTTNKKITYTLYRFEKEFNQYFSTPIQIFLGDLEITYNDSDEVTNVTIPQCNTNYNSYLRRGTSAFVYDNLLTYGGAQSDVLKGCCLSVANTTAYTPTAGSYNPATAMYAEQMVEATAPVYNSSSTYSVGDYVSYQGKLYVCNTAISVAENWTAAHWTETTAMSVIGNINTILSSLVSVGGGN